MTGSQPRPEVGSKPNPPPPIFMIFFSFSPELPITNFIYSPSFLAVTIWQEFENWGDTVPMRCATEMGNVNDQALFVFQRDDPRQNGVEVPFILLGMVAYSTITWLVETIPTAKRDLCVDGP